MIFLVDTSVMPHDRLRPLLETCARQGHQVEVPVLVYAERLFQLRRKLGARFDPFGMRPLFERFPSTISIQTLDPTAAQELAMALHFRFPDDAAWLAAKREVWKRCLGPNVIANPGANRACGGPVDAYIVGLASPNRPIVTEDGGPEWQDWPVGTVLTHAAAMRLAEQP